MKTSAGWLVAVASILFFAQALADTVTAVTRPPIHMAFNEGVYSKDALHFWSLDFESIVEKANGDTDVKDVTIEVLQRSENTRDQQAYFAAVTTTFQKSLYTSNGEGVIAPLLSSITMEFIRLGHDGSLAPYEKHETRKIRFYRGANGWFRTEEEGQCASSFYAALTGRQRSKLNQLIGRLYHNPGSPPVPFQATDGEMAEKMFSVFVPGVAKKFMQVAENVAHEVIAKLIKDKIDAGELRWGHGKDVTASSSEQLLLFSKYGETAAKDWKCVKSVAPNPPTSLTVE